MQADIAIIPGEGLVAPREGDRHIQFLEKRSLCPPVLRRNRPHCVGEELLKIRVEPFVAQGIPRRIGDPEPAGGGEVVLPHRIVVQAVGGKNMMAGRAPLMGHDDLVNTVTARSGVKV